MLQGVAEIVSLRYKQVAEDTLTTVRKQESSLKRFKKLRGGDGNQEAEGQTETDKMICSQLFLDVQVLYATHLLL